MINPQSDEKNIFDIVEINIFDSLSKIFFLSSFCRFYTLLVVHCNFWHKQKRENYQSFSFYHYQRFSRISKRKSEIVKSVVSHKRFVQQDNLFRPSVSNTLNSPQSWRIRSTCVTKLGCPFWTCRDNRKKTANNLFNSLNIFAV